MKKRNRVSVTMLLSLIVLFFSSISVHAADVPNAESVSDRAGTADSVVLAIHQLTYDKKWDHLTENTGEKMTGFTGQPVVGTEFKVYDVTSEYYQLREKNPDQELSQIQKEALISQLKGTETTDLTPVQTGDTNSEGTAELTVPSSNQGKDAVYLITANQTEPMVVALPVYAKDQELTEIHLYPKTLTETVTIDKKVTTVSQPQASDFKEFVSLDAGGIATYQLTITLPAGIKETYSNGKNIYTNIEITDDYSDKLALLGEKPKLVKAEGIALETIKISDENQQLKYVIEKDDIPKIEGNQLVLTYQLKLSPTEKYGSYLNTAKVSISKQNFDGTPVTDKLVPIVEPGKEPGSSATVWTGGHLFVKQDSNTKKILKGAEFVVKKEDTFLKQTNGTEWVATKEEATSFISTDNGQFEVAGLAAGTYELVETKAPTGYVLPTKAVTFAITDKATGEKTEYINAEATVVPNREKGFLPQTGDKGIIAFIVIGVAIITGVGYYFLKSRGRMEA